MKRTMMWFVGIGCAGLALLLTLSGVDRITSITHAESAKVNPAKPQQVATPTTPTAPKTEKVAEEKIAYTFADQTKIDEFTKLWQQRQGTVLRITVLQSYLNEEQAALQQLNARFAKEYNLDVNKNYRFDNERRVIVEVPVPPAPPSAPESSAPKASSSSTTP